VKPPLLIRHGHAQCVLVVLIFTLLLCGLAGCHSVTFEQGYLTGNVHYPDR